MNEPTSVETAPMSDSTRTAPSPAPAPIVFGSPERPLFGFYHAPSPALRRDVGVVLCNPLGYEAMCAHRAYRHLAERLAAGGVAALRFDYYGTGDSSGDADGPGCVAAWADCSHPPFAALRAPAASGSKAPFGVPCGQLSAREVADWR